MISFSSYDSKTLVYPDAYFKKITDNRYKDTNYSIVKESRRNWCVYVIGDRGVYLICGYWSKESAIEAIESGNLLNELKTQHKLLSEVLHICMYD